MKKTAIVIITILVLSMLLSGCAVKEYADAKEAEKEAEEHQKMLEEAVRQTESTRQQMEDSVREAPAEQRTVKTDSGDSVTLEKLDDYRRDRAVTEHCDFDYPFECSDSLAKDGVIYLSVKNQDYGSKVEDLTLYMDGDMCDPADVFIEPGQNKDFECYSDISKGGTVNSNFEIEYYRPIGSQHLTKTGELVIMME